jgi:hypothetical protein
MAAAAMPFFCAPSKRIVSGVALVAFIGACGSSGASGPSGDSGALGPSDATGDDAGVAIADGKSIPRPDASSDGGGGSTPGDASSSTGDGSSSTGDASPLSPCVPAIPKVAWTSPYAGWNNGIPTDPTFFPIAVWLQGSWHATELAQLGVNIYVGNNAGTDSMAVSDLATIKKLGMYAILGQDSVGLADIKDSTVGTTVVG